MAKKKITRARVTRKKIELLDEYVYAYRTCKDGKLPHEKFEDLSSIIFYYNMYYKRKEKLTIKEYLLQKVLLYAEAKKRKNLVAEILNLVKDTEEEILEKATENKFKITKE